MRLQYLEPRNDWQYLLPSAEVDGIVAGYPCQSISAQNTKPQSFRDKRSATGSGFHAFSKYVEKNPSVQWALLENVRQMMHTRRQFQNERPMEIQTKLMEQLGFVCCFSLLLNSYNFGLAQSRTRAWVLYVRQTNLQLLGFQKIVLSA